MSDTGRHDANTQPLMRAVVREQYGPVDNVQVVQLPRPDPTDDEVLVKVQAAGLDRGVWHLMTGLPYMSRLAFGLRRPRKPVLGSDFAGKVVSMGAAVTGFTVGDEVYGVGKGSFAEYTVASPNSLTHKPAEMSFAQAAVVPTSAVTALRALRDVGKVQPGYSVLITGASGGVGTYAVQLAKAFGAEVTAVASTSKLDLVRSLGADHVIDCTREDFVDGTRRYDLILDIAGNPPIAKLRRTLTPTGTAVLTGGENSGKITGMNRQLRALVLSPFLRQRMKLFVGIVHTSDLDELNELFRTGKISSSLDKTYTLDRVPQAIQDFMDGKVRGKFGITL